MKETCLCIVAVTAVLVLAGGSASAQVSPPRVELGAQIVTAASSEFEQTDVGMSGRVSWFLTDMVGVESEVGVFPTGFPGGLPFTRTRYEGLVGVTVGPWFDRFRPFGSARVGALSFGTAPVVFACILIYPPPLTCSLVGHTLGIANIGGGLEVLTSRRTFVRVDLGSRIVRYRGPALDHRHRPHDGAFYSPDFRFAAGGGWRF